MLIMGFITQEQHKEIAKEVGDTYAELYKVWFDTYAEDTINKWHEEHVDDDSEYDAEELIFHLAECFVDWVVERLD